MENQKLNTTHDGIHYHASRVINVYPVNEEEYPSILLHFWFKV